jgi:hypothetical protein
VRQEKELGATAGATGGGCRCSCPRGGSRHGAAMGGDGPRGGDRVATHGRRRQGYPWEVVTAAGVLVDLGKERGGRHGDRWSSASGGDQRLSTSHLRCFSLSASRRSQHRSDKFCVVFLEWGTGRQAVRGRRDERGCFFLFFIFFLLIRPHTVMLGCQVLLTHCSLFRAMPTSKSWGPIFLSTAPPLWRA